MRVVQPVHVWAAFVFAQCVFYATRPWSATNNDRANVFAALHSDVNTVISICVHKTFTLDASGGCFALPHSMTWHQSHPPPKMRACPCNIVAMYVKNTSRRFHSLASPLVRYGTQVIVVVRWETGQQVFVCTCLEVVHESHTMCYRNRLGYGFICPVYDPIRLDTSRSTSNVIRSSAVNFILCKRPSLRVKCVHRCWYVLEFLVNVFKFQQLRRQMGWFTG